MTTRKRIALPTLAALVLLSGCATPGPLHLYTTVTPTPVHLHDFSDATAPAKIPAFLEPGETLLGFAYDPFTDHFFLRLAPGDRFRVIDRPARSVKREFTVPSLATISTRGGDLAIRPRDGHVFAAHPTEPATIEFNRFGQLIRTLPLATLTAPPAALAYDTARDRLLALSGGDLVRVTTHDLSGQRLSAVALDRDVSLHALAYDSEKRELYALLAREPALGIFDPEGHLLRTIPFSRFLSEPAELVATIATSVHLDIGPRSFLRLF